MAVIGIILLILKIIGIILLALIGLILLLLLIVLFAPAKYSFKGSFQERTDIEAKFSWLFSLIRVEYELKDEEDNLIIKIPFFNIDKSDESNEEMKNGSGEELSQTSTVNLIKNYSDEDNVKQPNNIVNSNIEHKNFDNKENNEQNNYDFFLKIWYNKFKAIVYKIQNKFFNFKDKLNNIKNKAKDIFNQFKNYKDILVDFDREFGIKRCIGIAWLCVKGILKAIKPRTLDVDIVFGLDDPADTGMAMAAVSMAMGYLPSGIYIEGDYNNKTIQGRVNVSGRSNLLLILIPIIKMIFTKPVIDIIKKYWR